MAVKVTPAPKQSAASSDAPEKNWLDLGPINIAKVWKEVVSATSSTYHFVLDINGTELEITSSRAGNSVHVYMDGKELQAGA